MGLWRRFARFIAEPFATFAAQGQVTDEADPRPIDQVILEMSGRGSAPRVSRVEALSVPAVQRGRNMICSIATLPLVQHDRDNKIVRNPLLEQIDPDVPNVVTLAQTLEDLLFDAVSWWRILAFGWDGYPVQAQHIEVGSVSLDPPVGQALAPLPSGLDPRHEAVVWIDGKAVSGKEVIRFDSPNPALLKVCGRAIRKAALLDTTAAVYSDNPRPLDFFSPIEGADPIDDAEVLAILAAWQTARKARSTGYMSALKYNTVDSPSPADMQLVELQKQASLEIANGIGIDPEDLGVSTTSRTYANAVDRRRDRINDVLSPFMRAVTDRLTMGDVTKRGNVVVFDLDDYMKANPTERWETYKIGKEIGVLTAKRIAAEEGIPVDELPPEPAAAPATPPEPPAEPVTEPEGAPVDSARDAVYAFAESDELRTFDLPLVSFTVNKTARTVEGLALPYGAVASKYGLKYRFLKGSLRWNRSAVNRVKLLRDHDMGQPLGSAVKLSDGAAGLAVKFKVASGIEGDRALALASEGVLDGLSVGVDFDLATDVEMGADDVLSVLRADLREVSLTAMPAFDDARVTKVAASRSGGSAMPCSTCGQVHADGVACTAAQTNNNPPAPEPTQPAALALNADQISSLLAHPGALQALTRPQTPPAPAAPAGGLQLTREQLDAIIASGGLPVLLGVPQLTPAPAAAPEPGRQTVDPTRNRATVTATAVAEPMPYRFDREGNLTKGAQYDFSIDLFQGSKGDAEAMDRATKFMQAQFATMYAEFDVDKADVVALNPNRQRPDMYVDQREFEYPIWDTINKGTIADATPFVLPKFNTATGLVAAHVEAVEPTPGVFTATSQTITPSAVSGKVEITREAWDQGGNPQLSGIIWRQMVRAWFEALEASAVAMLDALTPTGVTLTTAAVNAALVGELEGFLASLQFVRGGFRMRDFFIQIDLYKRLIAAVDADGRKLLPLLGAVNSDGTISEFFADINIGGLRGRPSWALAATGSVAASSYLFDRGDVHGWATAPQRLEFQYRVAYVDVAVWGYKALANTDLTGVREVIYDPV